MVSLRLWSLLLLGSVQACTNAVAESAGRDPVTLGEHAYALAAGAEPGLSVDFCHAGACKVMLAPQYELKLQVDWSECSGTATVNPLAAETAGVMLWPTRLIDLAIPLADSGWFCKLPPSNPQGECIVSASQSARDLYLWGPVERSCSFLWTQTPSGIDAVLGPGCGMCMLEQMPDTNAASYAFNMGIDDNCRCPRVHFAASAAQLESPVVITPL